MSGSRLLPRRIKWNLPSVTRSSGIDWLGYPLILLFSELQGDDGWYSLDSPGLRPALTAASTTLAKLFHIKAEIFLLNKIFY